MAFVKLDCGILNSTLWVERGQRDVFLTALLMAEPIEVKEPLPQIEVNSLSETGFVVPPEWYGFVPAAGPGIVRMAMLPQDEGMAALAKLGAPDAESRSSEFDGRRLVRVSGGYIVLNFMKYRDRDYTGAERARRYRERQKEKKNVTRDVNGITRDGVTSHRDITQAECRVQNSEERKEEDGAFAPPALRPASPSFLGDENEGKIQKRTLVALDAAFSLPSLWGADAEALGWQRQRILRLAEKFRQYYVSGRGAETKLTTKGWRQKWSNWLTKEESYL